jgi:hypothetical protein
MKYTVAADALAKIECDGKEGHAGAKPRTVIEARPDARRDERRSRGARIGLARIGLDSDPSRRARAASERSHDDDASARRGMR